MRRAAQPSGPTRSTNSDAWLRNASSGFCAVTAPGEGDCAGGSEGSWVLSAQASASAEGAAQACLTRCAACARCRFITVNHRTRDYSWYLDCDLGQLHDRSSDFWSGLMRDRTPAPGPPGRFAAAREAVDASPLWVAIGVLVVPNRTFVSLPPARPRGEAVAWRLVTTDASQIAQTERRVVVVPCPDGYSRRAWADMQFSCFCKAAWWFRRALLLFPRARFLAKAEDDALVDAARLVTELQLTTRATRAPLHDRHVWYGQFG